MVGKWRGYEADDSTSSSAEVKKTWKYTSSPTYILMAWCLTEHRENITLFTSLDSWNDYEHNTTTATRSTGRSVWILKLVLGLRGEEATGY
jgi:hypothetical protein